MPCLWVVNHPQMAAISHRVPGHPCMARPCSHPWRAWITPAARSQAVAEATIAVNPIGNPPIDQPHKGIMSSESFRSTCYPMSQIPRLGMVNVELLGLPDLPYESSMHFNTFPAEARCWPVDVSLFQGAPNVKVTFPKNSSQLLATSATGQKRRE